MSYEGLADVVRGQQSAVPADLMALLRDASGAVRTYHSLHQVQAELRGLGYVADPLEPPPPAEAPFVLDVHFSRPPGPERGFLRVRFDGVALTALRVEHRDDEVGGPAPEGLTVQEEILVGIEAHLCELVKAVRGLPSGCSGGASPPRRVWTSVDSVGRLTLNVVPFLDSRLLDSLKVLSDQKLVDCVRIHPSAPPDEAEAETGRGL